MSPIDAFAVLCEASSGGWVVISDEYKESVLPSSCTKRIAIEAGVTGLWYKYVGLEGKVLGIDRFGISAPGNTVMAELGMTGSNVVSAAG